MMTIQPTSENLASETENKAATMLPSEAADIVSWVRKKYTKCKDQRTKFEKQWYTNLAFYFGKQNIAVLDHKTTGIRVVTPNAPYWRARPVVNKIRPVVRKERAKLLSTEPTAYVIPASSEDKDMFAAQAGESIWRSLYDQENLHGVFTSAVFWVSITGSGFVKVWWDPEGNDEFNSMPGKIAYESVTPFHLFFPDMEQTDLEKQEFVIHASLKSVDAAKFAYPDVGELKPTATSEAIMDTGFMHLIGADDPPLESVEIIECWIKPGQCAKFPTGAMITVVGEKLAQYVEGWPYLHGKYPFAMIRHIDTGGFYGDSIVTDLISPQREYNRTRGQIIESKNRMSKPQLLAPKGSVNPSSITTEPGQVILYRAGFNPPQPLPLQNLPNYVLDELERIKADMDDISGQHDVSRGGVPPGVTAATAISYLQEQDDTMLSLTMRNVERAVEKVAHLTLNYVVQYWDAQRMVKVTGADGSFDVVAFMGADLNQNTDIRIERDSALPTSRAAKQAFLMDLMKMGFIDPNRGLELMEVGGLNKLYDQMNLDKRHAQRENIRLQQMDEMQAGMFMENVSFYKAQAERDPEGMPRNPETGEPLPEPPMPPNTTVNTWDNHMVHIQAHNDFRKTQSFEVLPDPIKAVFEAHVKQHEMVVQQQMMMQAGLAQGGESGTLPNQPVESSATIRNEGAE